MKTIKTLLAWLDWSTYCKSAEGGWKTDYKFPVSICPLFWRTLFAIVALPITWITHVWNLLFVKMEKFREENFVGHKLNLLNTLVFTLVTMFLGMIFWSITDGKDGMGLDFFHISDPFLLSYVKFIGAALVSGIAIAIGVGILFGAGWLIWYAVTSIRDSITGSKYDNDNKYIPSSERAIPRAIDAVMNKYCPKIDWSSVKKR